VSISFRSIVVHSAFMDSSGFLPLVAPNDAHYQEARTLWQRLERERWSIFTTNFVVAETHSLFLVRLNQMRATEFLREIETSSITIIRVNPNDEKQAREIIFKYDDKDFSLVDATSFVIMERLGIPYAFTFDRHFSQYGFTALVP